MENKDQFQENLKAIMEAIVSNKEESDLTILFKELIKHHMSSRTDDMKSFFDADQIWMIQYNFGEAMESLCREFGVNELYLKLDAAENILQETTAAIFGGACCVDRARGVLRSYINKTEEWPENRPYHLPPQGSLGAWMLHASRCFSGPRGYHKLDPDPLGLRLLIEEGLIKPEHYIDPTEYKI